MIHVNILRYFCGWAGGIHTACTTEKEWKMKEGKERGKSNVFSRDAKKRKKAKRIMTLETHSPQHTITLYTISGWTEAEDLAIFRGA